MSASNPQMQPIIRQTKRVTVTTFATSPGFEVRRVSEVPENHRIPGMSYVVMGPTIDGSPGVGSYGSGRTPEEAMENAYRIFQKEISHAFR